MTCGVLSYCNLYEMRKRGFWLIGEIEIEVGFERDIYFFCFLFLFSFFR